VKAFLSVFVIVIVVLALLAGSYAGRWFPFGDSLAVVRPMLSAGLFALAMLLIIWRGIGFAAFFSVVALISGGQVAVGFYGDQPDVNGDYTLYQKNLLLRAWPRYSLADDILASGADFVTLQEVSDHNKRFMIKMFTGYEHKAFCPDVKNGEVAILSRFAFVDGSVTCADDIGLIAAKVALADKRQVWIVSLHLRWPFPYDQFQQVTRFESFLADLDAPVILGGDFNMVPWGASVARIADAAGVKRVGPYRDTFPRLGFISPLPIDQVMLPPSARAHVETRPPMGSDHRGVLVRFDL